MKGKDLKSLLIRLPKEKWVFLKQESIEQERSVNSIFNDLIESYYSRIVKKKEKRMKKKLI